MGNAASAGDARGDCSDGEGWGAVIDACNCGNDVQFVRTVRKGNDGAHRTPDQVAGLFPSPRADMYQSPRRNSRINRVMQFGKGADQGLAGGTSRGSPQAAGCDKPIGIRMAKEAFSRSASMRSAQRGEDEENQPSTPSKTTLIAPEIVATPGDAAAGAVPAGFVPASEERERRSTLVDSGLENHQLEGFKNDEMMDFEQGIDPTTGHITVIAHSKKNKAKDLPTLHTGSSSNGQKFYHPHVQPTLTPKVEKEVLGYFMGRKKEHMGEVMNNAGATNFRVFKQQQNLSDADRDLLTKIKTREAQHLAVQKARNDVEGDFWHPHTGVAPVMAVKAMRDKGRKIVDSRPDYEALDATVVCHHAGIHIDDAPNHHRSTEEEEEEEQATAVDRRRAERGQDQDGVPASYKPPGAERPLPEQVFGPGARFYQEQLSREKLKRKLRKEIGFAAATR
mmetsp:Transcript_70888/g.147742  ORF Transcript_70888/g.147742 Transcript_70888/m.147742 type:complete len:450 (+) Transcript_70888:58-1407(+)|eukprot:CAMPEP_0181313160 /NCGR_PEP_ID=MMETSP1101-20121128/14100_1 /TAXON_ID=46948 /ORGANISM="Rhodomonas abbreviata, Strain Caron Lab Isolate" /LENGTH=449 /DNA_ID=CAMNT_0023420095 /DNA_START=57 /DNA_END=1406 /DNA_ORIENTATION=-